ncbi:MAG: DNA-binding protein [Deltaproteobacteria bacterium]|nr:DNA-binding protein [Deltaproteobacteria bacterium]
MEKIKSSTCVVCDAGPVIHLSELNVLHVFNDFQKVIIPSRVHDEILKYAPLSLDINIKVIREIPIMEESLRILCKNFSLDIGETDALAVISQRPGYIFLTDDAAARLVANKAGIKVHGTIGLLLRAVRRELLTPQEVIDILYQVPERSSLFIKASLLEQAISSIRQQFM